LGVFIFVLIILVWHYSSTPVAVVPDYGEPTDAVRQAYLEFLGREPDPPGRDAYLKALSSGELTISKMRESFENSEEAKERGKRREMASKDLKRLCAAQKPGKSISSELLASVVSNSHDISVTMVKQGGQEVSVLWEKQGLILAPAHFYVPLPKTQDIERINCNTPSKLSGVDMNDSGQKRFLHDVLLKHKPVFVKTMQFAFQSLDPYEFKWENCCFGGAEAQVYWSMIVHFRPKKILEVGAGWSTKLAANAVRYLSGLSAEVGDVLQIPRVEAIDPYATGDFEGTVKIRNEMQVTQLIPQ